MCTFTYNPIICLDDLQREYFPVHSAQYNPKRDLPAFPQWALTNIIQLLSGTVLIPP